MTLKDCEEALSLNKQLEKYKAFLEEQKDRLVVHTVELSTGRETETVSFKIPMPYIRIMANEEIKNIADQLAELGIDMEGKQ